MTMMEMAHERAVELGLELRMMSDDDGGVLFALEYPEEADGPRKGIAIRVRDGVFVEDAAKWLLGQMASAELLEEAEYLASDDLTLTIEDVVGEGSDSGEPDEPSDRRHKASFSTAILEAQLHLSLLLDTVRKGEPSSKEIEQAISEIAAALNRPWTTPARQDGDD